MAYEVTAQEDSAAGDIVRQLAAAGMRRQRAERAGMAFFTNGSTVTLVIRGGDITDDMRIAGLTVEQAVKVFEVVERLRS